MADCTKCQSFRVFHLRSPLTLENPPGAMLDPFDPALLGRLSPRLLAESSHGSHWLLDPLLRIPFAFGPYVVGLSTVVVSCSEQYLRLEQVAAIGSFSGKIRRVVVGQGRDGHEGTPFPGLGKEAAHVQTFIFSARCPAGSSVPIPPCLEWKRQRGHYGLRSLVKPPGTA